MQPNLLLTFKLLAILLRDTIFFEPLAQLLHALVSQFCRAAGLRVRSHWPGS